MTVYVNVKSIAAEIEWLWVTPLVLPVLFTAPSALIPCTAIAPDEETATVAGALTGADVAVTYLI